MKSIAVLLTVHNRKDKTLACLSALFKQQSIENYKLDVFLVDDGCTDGTAISVTTQFPSVIIIKGNGQLYWNRGMYLAWTTARKHKDYDYYLWLNDDTLLNELAIKTLLETVGVYDNKSIIVGTTCATNSNQVTYGGRSIKGELIEPTNVPQVCNYFNGNIVLIPKAVYDKVGVNDPVFHHALGDFDYGLRANKLGFKSYVAPKMLGTCDTHESLATWCNPRKKFKYRWKAFRSPLGNNPEEFFVYEWRHNGLIMALLHYFTNHLRVFSPSLWN